jgi:hypothetical protein
MTLGEAINERARCGSAFVSAESRWARSSPRDVKERYLAGIALANARYAFEQAQRVEKELRAQPSTRS